MVNPLPPIEPLDPKSHDRSTFQSGEPSLDSWIRHVVGQATRRDGARMYVASVGQRVVGFYSLCAFQVDRTSAPDRARAGLHEIPAVLLARLAVDGTYQGRGLGAYLLLDALRISALVAERIGVRLMVVHALHEEAAGFYVHYGFTRLESAPLSLYLLMQDIRKTLATSALINA
jgi:GNAT superfamily N-acetyltransferase